MPSGRQLGDEMVTALFNFRGEDKIAHIDMGPFEWTDLLTGETRVLREVTVPANGCAWYYRSWKQESAE